MFGHVFYESALCVLNYLDEEERAGTFTLIVFMLSYVCLCSVPLPRDAVGWSVTCACDISWPLPLVLFPFHYNYISIRFDALIFIVRPYCHSLEDGNFNKLSL